MDNTSKRINEEALKRWLADGWLEDDFQEKGIMYRVGVANELLDLYNIID